VTGILSDVAKTTAILHEYGALAVWDYTAAAPSVPIDMTAGMDAIAFSPHKFVGGPQTPGVLVVRRDLIDSEIPSTPGGGTIAFVDPSGALYADDPVAREEGGTPAIVESIRAGAVIALRQAVGTEYVRDRGEYWWRRARERWSANPNIEILGDLDAPRLPIVSFRVHRDGLVLHHGFVVALLNDLFGIQARGGCSCAGPYGHLLLCITPRRSSALRAQAARGYLGVKPGWSRINFSYFISDVVGEYLIDAVDLVAQYGHRLLTDYCFDPFSGHWRHQRPHRSSDRDVIMALFEPDPPARNLPESVLAAHLDEARALLLGRPDRIEAGPTGLPDAFEDLREFHLPPSSVSSHSRRLQ
jgi:selenocysteine lyase/cysteine desulfurase